MLVEDGVTWNRSCSGHGGGRNGYRQVRLRHQHHYGDPNYWLLKVWEGRKSAEQATQRHLPVQRADREYDDRARRAPERTSLSLTQVLPTSPTTLPLSY